jgi:hypothetical protein
LVVAGIVITANGSGYTVAPQAHIVDTGTGTGAVVNVTIGGATMTNFDVWPSVTLDGVGFNSGDSGFANGPDLAFAINQTPAASGDNNGYLPGIFVTYLSVGDAAFGPTGGNNSLSYNGVPCTVNNVVNGMYSFWSYEHMYWLKTSSLDNYFCGIALQLYYKESSGGTVNVNGNSVNKTLRPFDLSVTRGAAPATEGGVITSGNTRYKSNAFSITTH